MKALFFQFVWGLSVTSLVASEEIVKISLPLIPGLQRADIYLKKPATKPAGILILCPGFNESGEQWIQRPVWGKFAREHNLALAGLSFASDGELLKKEGGYYNVADGSGQLLLKGLDRYYDRNLPLLLYGFSGGAHFAAGFSDWKPERVLAWSAYAAHWWIKPSVGKASPPGLVACGNDDEAYGASLTYFKQGRALGKPWLWVGISKTDHVISPDLEDFVRAYFNSVLESSNSAKAGLWVDIDSKAAAEPATLKAQPSLTAWLPDAGLQARWQDIHSP